MKKYDYGHIVNIASLAGTFGLANLTDYCASKFAVIGFSESLRVELQSEGYDGINVTVVCPSLFDSKLFAGASSGYEIY